MAYSRDLRIRVVEAYEEGEGTMRELAERFRIDHKTVHAWVNRYKQTGDIKRKSYPRSSQLKLTEEVLSQIKELLTEENDLTDAEIKRKMLEKHHVSLSMGSVNKGVHLIGWTRKKNFSRSKKVHGSRSRRT